MPMLKFSWDCDQATVGIWDSLGFKSSVVALSSDTIWHAASRAVFGKTHDPPEL